MAEQGEKRRLAAIYAADMVGYSHITAQLIDARFQDEVGWGYRLSAGSSGKSG